MKNVQAHNTETKAAFEKRWRAYAAGAGAVAAGLLAFAPPARAEIVVTQAHVVVGDGGPPFVISIGGTTEFTVAGRAVDSFYCNFGSLTIAPASAEEVAVHSNKLVALKFGAVIGPANHFGIGREVLAFAGGCRDFNYTYGPFLNTANRFLGLKFVFNGEVYYGWAGFRSVADRSGVLTAWAYETEPNTPIYAGQSSDSPRESRLLPASGSELKTGKVQPATLGVLALGSLGLNAWRGRETLGTDAPE